MKKQGCFGGLPSATCTWAVVMYLPCTLRGANPSCFLSIHGRLSREGYVKQPHFGRVIRPSAFCRVWVTMCSIRGKGKRSQKKGYVQRGLLWRVKGINSQSWDIHPFSQLLGLRNNTRS